jgi:hypothetical protein
MKKLLLTACVLATALCCTRVVQRPAPELIFSFNEFPELEHVHNIQGCAIDQDYLFSLEDKAWCNVFDLRINEPVAHFPLGSYGKHNHANIAFFGPTHYDSSDKFPLLYVSQCKSKIITEIGLPETDSLSRLLFVERLLTDESGIPFGSELVQLVHYDPAQWNSRLWIYDPAVPSDIWCYGNTIGNCEPDNHIVFKKFRFPEFSPDKFLVELRDSDVIEQFNFDELLPEGARGPQNAILQGAFIKDGIMFLPCGVGTEEHPSELFYAGLPGTRHAGKYGSFDFTDVMPCEPEDLDFRDGWLYCPCNADTTCRVYRLPYRDLVRAMVSK